MKDIIDSGAPIYYNWKLMLSGKESGYAFEVPLFTDAHITSKNILEQYGPYEFINTVPLRNNFLLLQPSIVLRVANYIEHKAPEMTKTREENYHGGNLVDEIAALVSLCLGVRVKSGATTREFTKGGDPRGFPVASHSGEDPILPPVKHAPILPRATGTHLLNNIDFLLKLSDLTAKDSTALLRAARLYQNGMWISESDPLLSWIMLVSAIETAADHYWKSQNETSIKRLETSRPGLSKILKDYGDVELEQKISDEIADITGARRKFKGYVLKFLPDPPLDRPEEWAQLNWESNLIKKSMDKIYDYRSRALHGGIPFPAPMGLPPLYQSAQTKAWEEIPSGLSISTGGHVWLQKDLPMNLHTFEYITRNVLLNWWTEMSTNNKKISTQ